MKSKQEILEYIKSLAEKKLVTREEIISAYDSGSGKSVENGHSKKFDIAQVLYFLGGVVVFLGIVILLAQNWSILNIFTKILVTLGAGSVAFIVGVLFGRDKQTASVASAFYLISALVLPIGIYVVFDYVGIDVGEFAVQTVISGLMLAMYLVAYLVWRKNVLLLFSIIFGTWLFFSLTSLIAGDSFYFNDWQFYAYRFLVAGLSYILLAYSFAKTEREILCTTLYNYGIFVFLAAALTLTGWDAEGNLVWELIFPVLVLGTMFLSVRLKVNSYLVWGAGFLMIYIMKITSQYFSASLGWPLALVLAGLAMIGVGYFSLGLKKKYLQGGKSNSDTDLQ